MTLKKGMAILTIGFSWYTKIQYNFFLAPMGESYRVARTAGIGIPDTARTIRSYF